MNISDLDKATELVGKIKQAKRLLEVLSVTSTKVEIRVVPIHGEPLYIQPKDFVKERVSDEVKGIINSLEDELLSLGVNVEKSNYAVTEPTPRV